MRSVLLAATLAAAAPSRWPTAPPAPPGAEACTLFAPGADAVPAAACILCHGRSGRDSHPVDVEYARVQAGRSMDLRSPAEAIRRGVLLQDGKVGCVTCHDARSPWKHRIVLPPKSRIVPAVDPHDPATYDRRPGQPPQAGEAVSAKPLCLACHALD